MGEIKASSAPCGLLILRHKTTKMPGGGELPKWSPQKPGCCGRCVAQGAEPVGIHSQLQHGRAKRRHFSSRRWCWCGNKRGNGMADKGLGITGRLFASPWTTQSLRWIPLSLSSPQVPLQKNEADDSQLFFFPSFFSQNLRLNPTCTPQHKSRSVRVRCCM